MPYSNPKQAIAIYLDIKRRKGAPAAQQFAQKHHGEMAKSAKAVSRARQYQSRRGSNNA